MPSFVFRDSTVHALFYFRPLSFPWRSYKRIFGRFRPCTPPPRNLCAPPRLRAVWALSTALTAFITYLCTGPTRRDIRGILQVSAFYLDENGRGNKTGTKR